MFAAFSETRWRLYPGLVGDAAWIAGIMNAEKHRQVLIHQSMPSGNCLIGNGFIFQHGNDPKHTANAVKSLFGEKNIW